MRRRAVLAAVALCLVATSCGTRLEHREVVAANDSASSPTAAATGSAIEAASASEGSAVESTGAVNTVGPSTAKNAPATSTGGRDRSSNPAATALPGGATRAAGSKSPVKIASVGTISGPAGSTFKSGIQGLQVWTKWRNARGGINGHQVQLIVADDGGDPSRHRAQVQDAVEKQHVVAFVQNHEAITGRQSVAYLTSKRVPVIGSDTGGQWFYESPMYFPQAPSGDALITVTIASAARQSIARGKRKYGLLTCREAQVCTDFFNRAPAMVQKAGLQLVYRGQASIAQPDFTAECLSARNAGAEVVQLVMDVNSVRRFANACGRQGYRPTLSTLTVVDGMKSDPNLNGLLVNSDVFAWVQDNTPATADFQAAIKAFGAGIELSQGPAYAWTSATMFEKAAANIGEPPRSEDVLKGLWSMKNETLGGLTGPLTFTEGKNAPVVPCWFNLSIQNGRWVSFDNFKLNCV